MRIRFWVVLLLVFLQSYLFAIPVVIQGKSSAGDAYVFRAYVQTDPISGREVLVDQVRPNDNGEFTLDFQLENIQKITIKVGLQSLDFYAQPGKTYHLNFNEIKVEDQNVFLPQSPLRVVFEEEDMLNLVIDGFDFSYTRFLQNQFIELIKYRDRRIYDLFETSMLNKFEETPLEDSVQKEFFKSYIEYRLADIRLSARLSERDSLGFKMIDQQAISMNNPAYSQFFMKFFDKYFFEYNKGELFGELQQVINSGLGLNSLFDKMGADEVIKREQIRELVLLYALKQVYFNRQITKENINTILLNFASKSKFELNRSIAQNLFISLTSFQKGGDVPEFSLVNQKGENRSNKDYLEKFVYLMFISPDCETCESDIRILKSLENQYTEYLDIVCIYAGYNQQQAKDWMQQQKVSWDYLWFENNYTLLNDYRVKNFPKYLVLDRAGKLLYYFPPKPREDFLGLLNAIKESEKEFEQESSDFFRKN